MSMPESFDPIAEGLGEPPKPLPKGIPFADRVTVHEIPYRVAAAVYKHHHSYVSTGREQSFLRHGVYLDNKLVGAIDWAFMLASDPIGFVPSDCYAELARVAIAIDMPNLASCAVAKSQRAAADAFADHGIRLLVTYVRDDYDGTMFDALDGWHHDGHTAKGKQASNRPERDIRDHAKRRYVCVQAPFFSCL